jgi:hypothetical protein
MVLGRGAWIIQQLFNRDSWRQTGNGDTIIRGEISNWGIEYRALAGFGVGQRVETTNVCNWNYLDYPSYAGGGTIAPLRAGASGGFLSSIVATQVYASYTPSVAATPRTRH